MPIEIKPLSKGNPTIKFEPDIDAYQLSCLMRIADATEKMAANYDKLRADKEMYERWYNNQREENKKLQASKIALQGVITRMKNNLKKLSTAIAAQPMPEL